METQTYQRKPIFVEAVRVTEENFFEVAQWCQGAIISGTQGTQSLEELKKDKTKFIKVRVINPQRVRQTKAFVGDWVLYSEYSGYKVYTNGAFENAFIGPVIEPQSIEQAVEDLRGVVNASDPSEREEQVVLNHHNVEDEIRPEQLRENVPDGTYGGAREAS